MPRGPKGSFTVDAFDVLTPRVAYWVGYLITDGCIGTYAGRSPRLFLQQAWKNREQCYKLTELLGSTLPVKSVVRTTFGVARRFAYCSFSLPMRTAERLYELGIVPTKTGTAYAPKQLLMSRDFWRGVVDGDGTVCMRYVRMNSSSPRLANAFRRYLRQVCPFARIRTCQNQAGVWGIMTKDRAAALAVATILYADGQDALSSKAKGAAELQRRYKTTNPDRKAGVC